MENLWMLFMCVSVVTKGLQGALPHAASVLDAAGNISFTLACLFANPAGTLAALKGMVVTKPAVPAEVKT